MPNLKLDIIYYKTASDFELEFNLSGCCRMRTFKEKVDSPKKLVSTLAKGVDRSTVILIVTELFGENSGVDTVAKAVGLPLTAPNKAEYGIKTSDEIQMPKGAVPLVTKSGIYGGCIIESGPQSIIIVSGIRSLRHEIMKSYVHNYVFDVAQLEAYNERMGQNLQMSFTPKPDDEAKDESVEPAAEEAGTEQVQTPEETEQEETVEENEEEAESTEEEEILTQQEKDFEFDIPTVKEEVYSNRRPAKRGGNIALLIIVVLLLIAFGVLAYFFVYLPLTGTESSFFTEDNTITEFIKEWFMN